jgi:microcompartment protein CcmL/EutN
VIDLELVRAGDPVEQRPDLGIGADDVAVKGRRVTLTVHSLGAKPTPGGTAALVAGGRVLTTATIPPLAAPADLLPKTVRVTLMLPAGIDPATVVATVALPGDAPEVTRANNRVPLR